MNKEAHILENYSLCICDLLTLLKTFLHIYKYNIYI